MYPAAVAAFSHWTAAGRAGEFSPWRLSEGSSGLCGGHPIPLGCHWIIYISLGLLTFLEHKEIGACQGKPRIENRELHLRTDTCAVGVEEQIAGVGVIDDSIRGIGCQPGGVGLKGRIRQNTISKSDENCIRKLNVVVNHIEIGDPVDVPRVQKRVENEGIGPTRAC